ncbi:putative ubiquinol-cytochrome-c reductase cytochrome c1 protein [Botrytis fragariae]|uniref:Putative ubiquinol-cytochrome-c reductase cytochrome c1 protein n=1 Tax=Botrytis fragariae TaxID=1964551 RepID=A0A8H6EDF6_9HELO|nr:putative ubiquinol-cytochrome-c reductase cytochrome c1 protein [Botrytis fragariae]KAF5868184.1 putative ubiquinol-cytochrome-c reductase cytochrome c1 protein [Botrytis fragariae]
MTNLIGTRKLVVNKLLEFRRFTFHGTSSRPSSKREVSTLAFQDMAPSSSEPSSRSSSDPFSTLTIRKKRREQRAEAQAQASRSNLGERRDHTPPETPGTTIFHAPVSRTSALDPRDRAQALARGGPSLEFGSCEELSINNPRQLPFDLQQPILYKVCGTLEAALFDFTKHWAPKFFDDKNVESGREVELSFWEKRLAAPAIPVEAFENPKDIPRYHELLGNYKEIRHTFVHRKKPPVLYVDQMVADAIEITNMIKDEARAESLDEMHQILHHMGSLLRDQVTVEMKGVFEDRLQANRCLQKTPMGWLEASRLQEEESEILRDLNHENDVFASLYARSLQALEGIMEPLSKMMIF